MSNYPTGPDGCPTYYFDSNMMPNFNGTCNNNMPGGYETCCMCGGETGGIGECPDGCYDSPAGECVPNYNKPQDPIMPTKRGCYSMDEYGDYFKMDINNPNSCVFPNFWVPGPQPVPQKDCTGDDDCKEEGMECIENKCQKDPYFCRDERDCKEGKCIEKTCIPNKWNKDFYEKTISEFKKSDDSIDDTEVQCVFSNITNKIPNPENMNSKENVDIITNLVTGCMTGLIKPVTPKLFKLSSYNDSDNDSDNDSVKKSNSKQVLIMIVGIIVIFILPLLLYKFLSKNNKS